MGEEMREGARFVPAGGRLYVAWSQAADRASEPGFFVSGQCVRVTVRIVGGIRQ